MFNFNKLHIEILQEALHLYQEELTKQIEDPIISKLAIVEDNSYKSEATGYNLVEEVEYTEEYADLLEKRTTATVVAKHLQKLEKLIKNL